MNANDNFNAKAMEVMRAAVQSYTELTDKLDKTVKMLNSALDLMEEACAKPDPGPFIRPDNLDENEFLIVEQNCIEVYTKDKYLSTPIPAGCIATPINPWLSVKHGLPDPCDPVLITDGQKVFEAHWESGEGFVISGGLKVLNNITHWMPLPNPPGGERK